MKTNYLLLFLAVLQSLTGVRVLWRMFRSAGGKHISPNVTWTGTKERVSVIVPVLNEQDRLAPCLDGLIAQGTEVVEILVIDGGSVDGTQGLVCTYRERDPRVRLIDASPVPANYNGKAWGLQAGLAHACPNSSWILTVDADVRPKAALTRALLEQARQEELPALSVATLQEIAGFGEGFVHPSLLTTLVYRFGIPGNVFRRVSDVQANGQCFLFRRAVLDSLGGFQGTYDSLCEDITIARTLVAAGYPLGFYEAGDLITVKMYDGWLDTWRNWTRSLPMHDRFSGRNTVVGWLEVLLVQALPLPLLLILAFLQQQKRSRELLLLNSIFVVMRIGVLFGTVRAYRQRPWSYWLSPFCDLPVAIQLGRSALRHQHVWRGRILVRGGLA